LASTFQKSRKRRTQLPATLIPLNFTALVKRNDAAFGKVHIAGRKLANPNVLGHGGSHALDSLIHDLGLLGGVGLRTLAHLLAAVELRHGQRHDVRVVLVHLRILLQRGVRHPRKLRSDLVDVDHLKPPSSSVPARSGQRVSSCLL
jgi:hypothetical protein